MLHTVPSSGVHVALDHLLALGIALARSLEEATT